MKKPFTKRERLSKPVWSMLMLLVLTLGLASCRADAPSASDGQEVSADSVVQTGEEAAKAQRPTVDPSGAAISVPEEINSIVVLAPSLAETVVALGCGDKITAYDTASVGLEGLPQDKPALDTVNPDMEQLTVLAPDLLLVSNLSLYDETNPYQQLIDLGVCVACVPTSDSIADIQSDIAFVAAVLGREEKGQEIISQMQEQIDRIAAIGSTITEKKTVYFEISAAPYMYSFGKGVFLNELIELIGAQNILADQEGWLSVGEETVVAADPDVILTNVNYIEDPVGEIKSRSGWEALKAVQNSDVYHIDNMASSLPDHNVVKAMEQMAEAIYPEYYGE